MEKRNLTNVLLSVVLGGMALGAIAGIALNWKALNTGLNGLLGDGERVTFTQIVKKENYLISPNAITPTANYTLKDGVYTIDNSAGSADKYVYGSAYAGKPVYFESESHDLTGFGIYYVSVEAKSEKINGSKAGVQCYDGSASAASFSVATTKVNVWEKASGVVVVNQVLSYKLSTEDTKAVGGDVLDYSGFQIVNIRGLGIYDTTEAAAVWESLTKGEYFEGSTFFTKGEIKKAAADWEAAQKALASSASSAA